MPGPDAKRPRPAAALGRSPARGRYPAQVTPPPTPAEALRLLRERADEDFTAPPAEHERGRHTADLPELGLRVSLTRSRYPNRADGVEAYAVTISRLRVDGVPDEAAVQSALTLCFGPGAAAAVARPGGPAVRLFRVPCAAVAGS